MKLDVAAEGLAGRHGRPPRGGRGLKFNVRGQGHLALAVAPLAGGVD